MTHCVVVCVVFVTHWVIVCVVFVTHCVIVCVVSVTSLCYCLCRVCDIIVLLTEHKRMPSESCS